MGYLITAVGIDLAAVNSGLSTIRLRAESWERQVVDAAAVGVAANIYNTTTNFNSRLIAAQKIIDYVKRMKPDIVGVEDYTNQFGTHVGFSMGEMGGIVRTLLWQEGFRQLLIQPSKVTKFILPAKFKDKRPPTGGKLKQAIIEWVRVNMQAEFKGGQKQVTDMADATVYAVIAAIFFSIYWLQLYPPLSARQMEIYYAKVSRKEPKSQTGLLDNPYRFLIRNHQKEGTTYTPEWLKSYEVPPEYVGLP